MIKSYSDSDTRDLAEDGKCPKHLEAVKAVALRKLDMVKAAIQLRDLASPPGNKLEPLQGDRKGQHSIRINNKWRICFVWTDAGPENVEITDYH